MWAACLASLEAGRATSNLDLTLLAKCIAVSHLPEARTNRIGKWSLILAFLSLIYLIFCLLQAPCCQLYASRWPLALHKQQRLTAGPGLPQNLSWPGCGWQELLASSAWMVPQTCRTWGQALDVTPGALLPLWCSFCMGEISGVVSAGALVYSTEKWRSHGGRNKLLITSLALSFCAFYLQLS